MAINNICPHCLKEINYGNICPNCGFDMNTKRSSSYLPYGAVIDSKYFVGKVLEKNGDGVTYLGLDLTDNEKIRIREFYPYGLCRRTGNCENVEIIEDNEYTFRKAKNRFVSLWRKLAQLRGISSLVSVFDIVEQNSTVYAVAEYNEEITLRDYLMENSGFLSWEQAKIMLMPVLNCINSLHSAGICHMGISPYTLLVGSDGKVKVWGFSIKDVRTENNIFKTEIYEGFAPIEAYDTTFDITPEFDVYSFAAVLYRVLIGSVPIDSKIRFVNDQLIFPAGFTEKNPAYLINALANALKILPENRTENIDKFREELSATPGTVEKFNPVSDAEDTKPKKKERIPVSVVSVQGDKLASKLKTERIIFSLVIALLVMGIAVGFISGKVIINKNSDNVNAESSVAEEQVEKAEVVAVPNFIGFDKDNNTFSTDYPDLTIRYEQAAVSYSPENRIVAQSVSAGTYVRKGTVIILSYYGATGEIVIPDFTGKTSEEALITLGQLGFNNVKIEKRTNDAGYPENTVIEQTPAGGSVITGESRITVYVWDKAETTTETTIPETTTVSQNVNNANSVIDSVFNGIGSLLG